jgi:hypothetical protein
MFVDCNNNYTVHYNLLLDYNTLMDDCIHTTVENSNNDDEDNNTDLNQVVEDNNIDRMVDNTFEDKQVVE